MSNFDKKLYLRFLYEARQMTLVRRACRARPPVPGYACHDYQDGRSRLIVLQTGLEQTSLIEIGYRNKVPVWNLCCRGSFLKGITTQYGKPENLVRFLSCALSFLSKALGKATKPSQIRGPESYIDQTMEYECEQAGEALPVNGTERIFYQERLIYQAHFQAGWLINSSAQ